MSENSEKFPTSKLQERYGITRSAIYSRLDALHIKPARQGKGNKTYITSDQLQLMDDLNAHMKGGGKIEEFVQQCITDGRIVVLEKPAEESTISETAIVRHTETQTTASQHQETDLATTKKTAINPEARRQNKIENLQAQKGERVRFSDIQEVNERAQKRAFDKAVAEEELVLIYEATEEFAPELKEQLEQHRAACRQARKKRMEAYDVNDFLSQAIQMTGIKF